MVGPSVRPLIASARANRCSMLAQTSRSEDSVSEMFLDVTDRVHRHRVPSAPPKVHLLQ